MMDRSYYNLTYRLVPIILLIFTGFFLGTHRPAAESTKHQNFDEWQNRTGANHESHPPFSATTLSSHDQAKAPYSAGDTFSLSRVAHIPGASARSLAVGDAVTVVGIGTTVKAVDVSDANRPKTISSLDLGGQVTDMVLSAGLVLVTISPGGLRSIDITNPESLKVVGSLSTLLPNGSGLALATGDGRLFVMETAWLRIVAMPKGGSLNVIGEIELSLPVVSDIDYVNGSILICTETEVRILDVKEPTAPRELASIVGSGRRRFVGMALRGTTAFIGALSGGLIVYNFSDPTKPREIASLSPDIVNHSTVSFWEPFIDSNTLYIPCGENGLRIIDVRDEAKPLQIGVVDTAGDARSVWANGLIALIVDSEVGLYIVNVSHPDLPTVSSILEWPSPASRVNVAGDTLYVAAGRGRLAVYDVAVKSAPSLLREVIVSNNPLLLARAGTTLLAVDNVSGKIFVIDVTRPRQPIIVGQMVASALSGDVTACGQYAYLSTFRGFVIVDIENKANPTVAGQYSDLSDGLRGIACDGGYVYGLGLVGTNIGLVVLDVRTPSQVKVVSQYYDPLLYNPRDIAATEGIVAVGGDASLAFVDVTDHHNPRLRQVLTGVRYVTAVAVSDRFLYASSSDPGRLTVWDVYDPEKPTLKATSDLLQYPGNDLLRFDIWDVSADAGLVVGAAGYDGLLLWEEVGVDTATATPPASATMPVATRTSTATEYPLPIYMPALLRNRR